MALFIHRAVRLAAALLGGLFEHPSVYSDAIRDRLPVWLSTKRSRSELAEKFMEMGLEAFEKEVDTDALLYETRKQEKDLPLTECVDILRPVKKLAE